MQTTSELRKELKKIGFSFKIKRYSEFTAFDYFNDKKEKYPSIFFGQDEVLKWKQLTEFLTQNKEKIISIKRLN